jgi:hypothetical protein
VFLTIHGRLSLSHNPESLERPLYGVPTSTIRLPPNKVECTLRVIDNGWFLLEWCLTRSGQRYTSLDSGGKASERFNPWGATPKRVLVARMVQIRIVGPTNR